MPSPQLQWPQQLLASLMVCCPPGYPGTGQIVYVVKVRVTFIRAIGDEVSTSKQLKREEELEHKMSLSYRGERGRREGGRKGGNSQSLTGQLSLLKHSIKVDTSYEMYCLRHSLVDLVTQLSNAGTCCFSHCMIGCLALLDVELDWITADIIYIISTSLPSVTPKFS